jgi:hypothetical protein
MDHASIAMPASTWELARFLGGALVVLYAALEWTNRHTPSTPLRNAWAWWRRNGVGPLRLAGRAIDTLRALGYCLADVVPAAWQRGRDRFPEYLDRARREY